MNTEPHRLTGREWHFLKKDHWLMSLVTWVPICLFILLWYIFSAGLPRNLSIAVVDLDHSQMSRSLIRHYDANPMLRLERQFISINKGQKALMAAEVNALIVLPAKMEADTRIGRPPQITVFYNAQFLLIGKLIASAVLQSQGTFNAKVSALQAYSQGKVGVQALGAAVPVSSQITALFNINNNYAQFLVTAIIPAMWQILIVVVTLLALTREIRLQGITSWLSHNPVRAMLAKLWPYTLILWLHGLLFLLGMYVILDWQMNGSWLVLILTLLLMVIASQAMAILLFMLVKDSARALSLAAAYTAPSFAFMGVTFPATDMTLPARIWRELLPVSHYIEVQIAQASHGASTTSALPQMFNLLLFCGAFLPALLLAKRLVNKSNKPLQIKT